MDNYENELLRKDQVAERDQIILELRDKINMLLSQPQVVTTQHVVHERSDGDE